MSDFNLREFRRSQSLNGRRQARGRGRNSSTTTSSSSSSPSSRRAATTATVISDEEIARSIQLEEQERLDRALALSLQGEGIGSSQGRERKNHPDSGSSRSPASAIRRQNASQSHQEDRKEEEEEKKRRRQADLDFAMALRMQEEESASSRNHNPLRGRAESLRQQIIRQVRRLPVGGRYGGQAELDGLMRTLENMAPGRGGGSLIRSPTVDLDNMSYEQILALQERLGQVKSRGATETELSTLPSCKFIAKVKKGKGGDDAKGKGHKDKVEKEECCFCLEEFKEGENIKRLPCLHIFHDHEIDKWLRENNTCPICKTPISAGSEQQQ